MADKIVRVTTIRDGELDSTKDYVWDNLAHPDKFVEECKHAGCVGCIKVGDKIVDVF